MTYADMPSERTQPASYDTTTDADTHADGNAAPLADATAPTAAPPRRQRRRRSKADAAPDAAAAKPVKASAGHEASPPAPLLTLGALALGVLRREYAALRSHEVDVLLHSSADAVHDMRVALRRLRAALSLFRDAVPARLQPFRREFAWIAAALGAVRDRDVMIEHLQAFVPDLSPEASEGHTTIIGWLQEEREDARQQLLAVLSSPRYLSVITGFASALDAASGKERKLAKGPAVIAAPKLLRRRYRKVRKAGDALTPSSSAADYHKLRIEGKRLRYALDFFADVYGKAVRPLRQGLSGLQDVLGNHQDYEVARARLRELRRQRHAGLAEQSEAVISELLARLKEQSVTVRRDFPESYRGVGGKRWDRLKVILDVRRTRAERGLGAAPEQ